MQSAQTSNTKSTGAQILVVEDDGVVAARLQSALTRLGYTVPVVVATGEEAVQQALEVHPELVLMDVRLGGDLDGIEATEQIHARLDLPVVYLTAYAEDERLQRAKITAPYSFLVKPVRDRELYATVEMALHRHRLETQLKERERWLDTTLRSIGDAVMITDAEGRVAFMNIVAEELTSWDQEEALGRDSTEVFHIVDAASGDPAENPVARVLREGAEACPERSRRIGLANQTLLIKKDGTPIPIDDSGAPIRDDKGHITGVILTFRDVAERMRAEQELKNYRDHLEELVKAHTTELHQEIDERKRVEETLRKREQEFRALAENAPDIVVRFDKELRHLYINSVAERVTGIPRQAFIGKTNRELGAPEALVRFWEQAAQVVLRSGQAKVIEYEMPTLTGPRYFEARLAPEFAQDGSVESVLVISRDITERVQAESQRDAMLEALRQERDFAEGLIETAQAIVLVLDTEGRIERFNPYLEEISGYRLEEVQGKDWFTTFLPEGDQERIRKLFLQAVSDIQTAGNVNPIVTKDGHQRKIEWYDKTLKDADGNVVGLLTVGQDITERVRAEEELRQYRDHLEELVEARTAELIKANEQLLREIAERVRAEEMLRLTQFSIDHAGDAAFWMGPDARFFYVNDATCRSLGYSREELLSMTVHDIDPDFPKEVWPEHWQVVKQRGSFTLESHHCTKDGRIFPVEIMVNYLDFGGKEYNCAFARDVTERVQAEEALRKRNRDLELLNRAGQVFNSTLALDDVLSTVLEEIRQMLDVVSCSAWLIETETGAPEESLVCRQAAGPGSEIVRGWRLAPDQGIAGWVVQHGESLIIPDSRTDERHFKGVDRQIGLEIRSMISVPLQVQQRVIGVIHVLDQEVNRFDTGDLRLLESLAAAAAIAVENARLYEAAKELHKQARRDAETKAVLLREVNHRVKNNLAAIVGLLYAEQQRAGMEEQSAYRALIKDLTGRVQGLATVHNMLSAAEWAPLPLDDLTSKIIQAALQVLPHGKYVSVDVSPSPVRVTPSQAGSLALVINELTTNTVKYVLGKRQSVHITVRLALEDDLIVLEYRDDGRGYPEEVLRLERHNVGLELIQEIVSDELDGEMALHNGQGAVALIRFKQLIMGSEKDEHARRDPGLDR